VMWGLCAWADPERSPMIGLTAEKPFDTSAGPQAVQISREEDAMLWLNLSLGMIFVIAVCGIPLWLVIKHPDTAQDHSDARRLVESKASAAAAQAGMHDLAA
jgi:hypothetical protein